MRIEFEDLGFTALHPMRARRIETALRMARGNRKELVEKDPAQDRDYACARKVFRCARARARKAPLQHLQKMKSPSGSSFSEIMDVYAFRIVVDSVDTCYRVLGCMHSLYKPIPGQFKDYIAIPKANGYQSLHTVLMGMHGVPIEVQIRTAEMEDMANNGIAAHWLYKSSGRPPRAATPAPASGCRACWKCSNAQATRSSSSRSVKIDLFPDEIYVFTPKGRILELPRRATAVDFAYAVHTDVGNSCVACRINRQLAPLSEPLQSGQTVEIITSPGARPNPSWLDYAVTAKARSNIHHFLKYQPNRRRPTTAGKQHRCRQQAANPATRGIAIRGTEGLVVTYARCCRPLPGDAIVGHLSAGRGIVIHRDNCNNVLAETARQARTSA
jgi:guanosine-3',5'-bis(diphosphate) 3'-pyrophosphohydrolase